MTQRPYKSETLDQIRRQIDALDQRIHDTLMERAELVLKIGEEKRKNNIQIVQPAREARMIRRLLTRHEGALPEMAVVRIWRELVGAVSLLQTGLQVSVTVPEDGADYWDLAKDYFGSCLPMHKMSSPLAAIAEVREDKANFAVVPWPDDHEQQQPWWLYLVKDTEDPMHIVIRLPHGDDPNDQNPGRRALVVSKSGFDESDHDRSFLMVECDSTLSRGRLVERAEKADLKPVSLYSQQATTEFDRSYHLVEVEGYVIAGNPAIEKLKQELNEVNADVICVGGYPVPPVYTKAVRPTKIDIPVAPIAENG